MRKWLKRIFLFLAVFLLAAIPTVYFGGKWAVRHYLSREIHAGPGSIRLVHPRWSWSLDLRADSAIYASPSLAARAGNASVSADLFRSLWHFSPSVGISVDSLRLVLHPSPDTQPKAKRPARDSVPLPNLKLPVALRVQAGQVRVADDSGFLAVADGIAAATAGKGSFTLGIDSLRARAAQGLDFAIQAELRDRGDSARARMTVARADDRATLVLDAPKANFLEAAVDLTVKMASSRPYARALGAPASLPHVSDLDLSIEASKAQGYRIRSRLAAGVSEFDPKAPYRIGPQKVEWTADFRDTAGIWSLRSHGPQGEDIALEGGMRALATDSLANAAWLIRHLEASARGHLRNIRLAAGGKIIPTDLEIRAQRLGPDALIAEAETGAGSRLSADLRKHPSGWTGPFSADIVPDERWVRAFADTALRFDALHARGRLDGKRIALDAVVQGLEAYGALADSLHLTAAYGPDGLELRPSYWHQRGIVWRVQGRFARSPAGLSGRFSLRNPAFGSAEARLAKPDRIELRTSKLALYALPYRGLDSLAARRPRLTVRFVWDTTAHTGKATAGLTGVYQSEALDVKMRADWDRRSLRIPDLIASLGGNTLRGGGELALHGRQFYRLKGLRRADVLHAFVEAHRFDLAKALHVASEHPPLLAGTLNGRMDYSGAAGFRGDYRVEGLRPAATEGLLRIPSLVLKGSGDSLAIRARTESEKQPLLQDSLALGVGGILDTAQTITLRAVANKDLILSVSGRMRNYSDAHGALALRGDAALPGNAGKLVDLGVRGDFTYAFGNGLSGLRMNLDTLRGRYAVPDIDTESFSAPMRIAEGRLSVPVLSIRGKSGTLNGSAAMHLAGARVLTVHAQGDGLMAQLGSGDRIRLGQLDVDLHSDTSLTTLQATLGSGTVEHVKAPLRVTADFSGLDVAYRLPKGEPAGGVYTESDAASLRLSAKLDSSLVSYRLRSFAVLQNLFQRKPRTRRVQQPTRPLQLHLDVETAGSGNRVETDLLRFSYVGNLSMRGIWPYALVDGRVNSSEGSFGAKSQAYDLSRLEIKWLNSTLGEGSIDLEAKKRLARNCEAGTTDSCTVTTTLKGPLSQAQFAYDTDCGGAFGAGANVAALVYSIRRGCYSSAFAGGGSGMSYQEQALALLEPLASDYLSRAARDLSGHWISQANVTGLGVLAPGQESAADTATEALALEVVSKEFWRVRLRLRSYYRPQVVENNDPWAYRLALEWRPPLARFLDDPDWKRRLKNNVSVDASIYTDTAGTMDPNQERIAERLGLNYNYRFWLQQWAKPQTLREAMEEQSRRANPDSAAVPDSAANPGPPTKPAPSASRGPSANLRSSANPVTSASRVPAGTFLPSANRGPSTNPAASASPAATVPRSARAAIRRAPAARPIEAGPG